jgi:ParB family chromosome partitioning protein
VRVCEQEKISIIPGTEGTGEFLRYTPRDQVAAVRAALGEIDLDPASDALGQKTVGAIDYFAVEDNSLEREWPGRVFLNPPYNRNLAPAFISKLLQELEAGRTTAAILLTNNCTDTDWFDVA